MRQISQAASRGARATDTERRVLKTRESVCKIPAISGEGSLLVNSTHARIHFVKRRIGH